MMTINEVRELKVGDTVVFNGGHSAIVMEIQAFGNGRIEYVLKDALEKAFHYNDVDISRCACGSYHGVETEINKVSSNDIEKIIDTMRPEGNFYCYDKKNKEYIAVDNTTGEAFTESFKDKKSCLDWLENKEKTV